jgi:hypothetical protein
LLRAELAMRPEREGEILLRYNVLNEASRRALEEHWAERLAGNLGEREALVGRLLLSDVTEPVAIVAIVEHLGLPARAPPVAAARDPGGVRCCMSRGAAGGRRLCVRCADAAGLRCFEQGEGASKTSAAGALPPTSMPRDGRCSAYPPQVYERYRFL